MADDSDDIVTIDPKQFIDGILAKYGLVGKPGTMFLWNQMHNKVIEKSDLNHLISSIGILFDRCCYQVSDRHNNRNFRQYLCHSCNMFKLTFIKYEQDKDNSQETYHLDISSVLQHNHHFEILRMANKHIIKYLEESPLLIDIVKRQLIEKPNRKGIQHDLIISGLCLNEGSVTRQSINQTVQSMKIKFKKGTHNTI